MVMLLRGDAYVVLDTEELLPYCPRSVLELRCVSELYIPLGYLLKPPSWHISGIILYSPRPDLHHDLG